MDNRYDCQTVDHAYADFPHLAIVESVIHQIKGEAAKDPAGIIKAQAVLCDVLQVLVVVPLKEHCQPLESL